jgi:hypothetical protein
MQCGQKESEMLEMKSQCEKCNVDLPKEGEATICSFECTFCAPCADSMQRVCPNCAGELVKRPPRTL